MNKIFITSFNKKFVKEEKKIRLAASKILKILKKDGVSVEIYLAGNAVMRSLNKKLRGKDKIANALSFEEPKKFISPELKFKKIGEIYLNAEKKDENFSKEFLLVHGTLHLLGYDHIKKSDSIIMDKKEKLVSKKLNIKN